MRHNAISYTGKMVLFIWKQTSDRCELYKMHHTSTKYHKLIKSNSAYVYNAKHISKHILYPCQIMFFMIPKKITFLRLNSKLYL